MLDMGVDAGRQDPLMPMLQASPIRDLMAELRSGLALYSQTAKQILRPCGVVLATPSEASFSLHRNFFSLLFLYSYYRADIPPQRRTLYAATLQCLRGMVTGCDNLLDDEYKPTLDTDLPASGHRFRSVVDIMVSDRVLFQILLDAASSGEIAIDQVPEASTASMQTMTRSGAQEASEETGITEILEPDVLIDSVHHLKTGILFQCPWDIPRIIENLPEARLTPLLQALYRIGMGCQILDDMVDMISDIAARRHNYLVSLVFHGDHPAERRRLEKMLHRAPRREVLRSFDQFPFAMQQASKTAERMLLDGLGMLFSTDDQPLVTPAVRFLRQRIGVAGFIEKAGA